VVALFRSKTPGEEVKFFTHLGNRLSATGLRTWFNMVPVKVYSIASARRLASTMRFPMLQPDDRQSLCAFSIEWPVQYACVQEAHEARYANRRPNERVHFLPPLLSTSHVGDKSVCVVYGTADAFVEAFYDSLDRFMHPDGADGRKCCIFYAPLISNLMLRGTRHSLRLAFTYFRRMVGLADIPENNWTDEDDAVIAFVANALLRWIVHVDKSRHVPSLCAITFMPAMGSRYS
jgi:hypothetical protein